MVYIFIVYFNIWLQEVWVDKLSGGVCVSICSKRLTITGIDDRRYWNHIPSDESRLVYLLSLEDYWFRVFNYSGNHLKNIMKICIKQKQGH